MAMIPHISPFGDSAIKHSLAWPCSSPSTSPLLIRIPMPARCRPKLESTLNWQP